MFVGRFRWGLQRFFGEEKPFPVDRTDLKIVAKWHYDWCANARGKFGCKVCAKCASRRSLLTTQLYPINRNFTGSRCNIIAKLNAAPHGRRRPAHQHDGIHEVV